MCVTGSSGSSPARSVGRAMERLLRPRARWPRARSGGNGQASQPNARSCSYRYSHPSGYGANCMRGPNSAPSDQPRLWAPSAGRGSQWRKDENLSCHAQASGPDKSCYTVHGHSCINARGPHEQGRGGAHCSGGPHCSAQPFGFRWKGARVCVWWRNARPVRHVRRTYEPRALAAVVAAGAP